MNNRSVRSLLRRLLGLMSVQPVLAAGAGITILIGIALTLIQPLLIRNLFNNGITVGNHAALVTTCVAIGAVALAQSVTVYLRAATAQNLGERIAYELRNRLFRHLQLLSFSFYDTAQTGQLLARLTEDVNNIRRFYSPALRMLVYTTVMVIGIAVVMFALNWQLALLSLAIVPVLLVITLRFGARVRTLFLGAQQQFGVAMTVLQENLAGVRVVRAFAREAFEITKFGREAENLYEQQVSAARPYIRANSSYPLITGSGVALVLAFGGWQVIHGILAIGTLLAFYLYLTQLADPVVQIGPLVNNVALALASAERVFDVLDRRPRIHTPKDAYKPAEMHGHVRLDEVHFAFSRETAEVLHGISLDARPGTVTGLVGPTGSGKSSIVQLFARFYDVNQGSVTIDDVDVREWDLDTLRANIGFVLQETFLFSVSLRENIAYGRAEATDDEVVAAAKAAQAHDFISRLPEGYDTPLGERGVNLSGGQKQRIAIARALLMNPRILVLDDATSSVDMTTERAIQTALKTLMRGRTTFIIAQRLSSVRHADQILVLDEGRIIERGTHDELLAADGAYRQVYDMQAAGSGRHAAADAQDALAALQPLVSAADD